MLDSRILCAVILGTSVIGCAPDRSHDDTHMAAKRTISQLGEIGDTVVRLVRDGARVEGLASLEDAMVEARKRGLLNESEFQDRQYRNDSWGREFRWVRKEQGASAIIWIISAGEDGKFEDGDGDDLYVQISVTGEKELQVYRKPLPYR